MIRKSVLYSWVSANKPGANLCWRHGDFSSTELGDAASYETDSTVGEGVSRTQGHFSFLIRENQQRGSQLGGLGVSRQVDSESPNFRICRDSTTLLEARTWVPNQIQEPVTCDYAAIGDSTFASRSPAITSAASLPEAMRHAIKS